MTDAKGTIVGCRAVGRSLAACLVAFPVALGVGAPVALADNHGVVGDHQNSGDTHITGQGVQRTLDCNNATLHVIGTGNQIFALGTCWAVTMQGSSNIVVADNVINDITVYGYDQTVFYKNGAPFVWDRGRELGMTNRIDRVPA